MTIDKANGSGDKTKRYIRKRAALELKKSWVRDAAVALFAADVEAVKGQYNREQMVFASVDVAARIWDQVEGRFLPEKAADG